MTLARNHQTNITPLLLVEPDGLQTYLCLECLRPVSYGKGRWRKAGWRHYQHATWRPRRVAGVSPFHPDDVPADGRMTEDGWRPWSRRTSWGSWSVDHWCGSTPEDAKERRWPDEFHWFDDDRTVMVCDVCGQQQEWPSNLYGRPS